MHEVRGSIARNTTPNSEPYTMVLLCITGAQPKKLDHYRMSSYSRALEITWCESIETTLRTRRLVLWAGALIRMSGGRLPKRIVFGNLENAVRRGRFGKEKEWTGCLESGIQAFAIIARGDGNRRRWRQRCGLRRSRRMGGGLRPREGKKK